MNNKFQYQPGVKYIVSANDEVVLSTEGAGRQPVTQAVKGLIGQLLQGKIREININGSDGSVYWLRFHAEYGDSSAAVISDDCKTFFDAEFSNAEDGGVNPPTLLSALDSLIQGDEQSFDTFDYKAVKAEVEQLVATYGGDTLLEDVGPQE